MIHSLGAYKNIITWLVKILVGLGSFAIIYWRLKDDLTPDKLLQIQAALSSGTAYVLLIICLVLVPINWGIESYKWKIITQPIEDISFGASMKSVYSGLCVGNLAPGRATEFLAKVLFFKPDNRPTITLLHFVNGMFQLSITIVLGLIALILKFNPENGVNSTQFLLIGIFCMLLLAFFSLFIFRFNALQKWIFSLFKKSLTAKQLPYTFTKDSVAKLFSFSIIRYFVFTTQFVLILKMFYLGPLNVMVLASVCVYFLLTTILPMISFIEPAIRAAIALLVFAGLEISEISLVTTAILVWLINIVLPSIVGYIIIVKEKFEFSLFKK
ncbi:MAG: flippase-like domain-containing protein [Sphingobacteriaceae bacterium]|nr:flippase-like domain-containing protein [Sphingobacteriaceae bacterium]